jgi:hypothetical protein
VDKPQPIGLDLDDLQGVSSLLRRIIKRLLPGLLGALLGFGFVACASQAQLVAVKETGFQCLHDSCIDPNGFLICFVTELYLYDDGTQEEGKKRQIYGPNACGDLPDYCSKYEGQPWKCRVGLNGMVTWQQP